MPCLRPTTHTCMRAQVVVCLPAAQLLHCGGCAGGHQCVAVHLDGRRGGRTEPHVLPGACLGVAVVLLAVCCAVWAACCSHRAPCTSWCVVWLGGQPVLGRLHGQSAVGSLMLGSLLWGGSLLWAVCCGQHSRAVGRTSWVVVGVRAGCKGTWRAHRAPCTAWYALGDGQPCVICYTLGVRGQPDMGSLIWAAR